MYNRAMTITNWLKNHNISVNDHALIEEAFIHRSYKHENKKDIFVDNQRLEFMGDAVLQLWSARYIFEINPPMNEGEMTKLRALMVCEDSLALKAKELALDQLIRLGKGELLDEGHKRASTLADCFEALIGALYLDQGFDWVDTFLKVIFKDFVAEQLNSGIKDYKTLLQEYVQADNHRTIEYVLLSQDGPANAREFEMAVKIDEMIYGKGKGTSKKRAEQAAAEVALRKLVK